MGLSSEISDFTLEQLKAEVREREARKSAGVCTYCMKDPYSMAGRIICKFPKRHARQEF